jgi:hypothetical protein
VHVHAVKLLPTSEHLPERNTVPRGLRVFFARNGHGCAVQCGRILVRRGEHERHGAALCRGFLWDFRVIHHISLRGTLRANTGQLLPCWFRFRCRYYLSSGRVLRGVNGTATGPVPRWPLWVRARARDDRMLGSLHRWILVPRWQHKCVGRALPCWTVCERAREQQQRVRRPLLAWILLHRWISVGNTRYPSVPGGEVRQLFRSRHGRVLRAVRRGVLLSTGVCAYTDLFGCARKRDVGCWVLLAALMYQRACVHFEI